MQGQGAEPKSSPMKKLLLLFALISTLASCKSEQMDSLEVFEAVSITAPDTVSSRYELAAALSSLSWRGFKPGSDQIGLVEISQGAVWLDGDKVVGGRFVVDMNTISVERLAPERATKLAEHLKNSDFFETEIYPVSIFEVAELGSTGVGAYPFYVVGNLTIKDITHAVRIGFDCIAKDSLVFVTTEAINLDRTKWNITYKSTNFVKGLKDNFIYDNMQLRLTALFALRPGED